MPPSAPTRPATPPQIQWRRFWCPLGSSINCGDDGRGFLADPEGEYGEGRNPNIHLLEALVPETGLLVLCGDPGIGKTTEFKRLRASLEDSGASGNVLALTFRQHISNMQEFRQRTLDTPAWNAWRNGTNRMTLMVDGIDEGLIRIPTFVSALNGLLEDEPLERLRLILTCRSAEWPHAQGDRLLGMWPMIENRPRPLYELCPLRYVDVKLAAESWMLNVESFETALAREQVVGLATRPVTLFFLLEEFKSHGCFPATHRELYHRGTLKLAGEIDPERLEILRASRLILTNVGPEQRLKAAQRLAALLLCCGRRAVHRDDTGAVEPAPNELTISQCSGRDRALSLAAFAEVMESALFTSVGHERFGFLHQTFAECLASMQLSELPLPQIRRLLMQRDEAGEHVVPQLIEVAAWTAGHHAAFCDHLLRVDPVSLLHCDASVLSGDMKSRLVEAILAGADSGQILDDPILYKFLHTLNHPGLADQLRPYIIEKSFHPGARSIAIKVAERCALEELTDDLFQLVVGYEDPARQDAAEALCEVISSRRLAELEPLARGESGPDPRQSIRGYALRRLVPTRWSVTDALPHIQSPADKSYYGAYCRFLEYYLPQQVKLSDVPAGLDWLQEKPGCFDSLSSRNKFATRLLDLALEHLGVPEIAAALTRLWFALAKRHQIHNLASGGRLKEILANDPILKRQILKTLLNTQIPTDVDLWTLFCELDVVRSVNDFDWLLEEIGAAASAHQPAWAEIIANHAHNSVFLTPCWDKFLKLLDEVPALKHHFEWLRVWNLDEPAARKNKARWLRQKRSYTKGEKRRRAQQQDPRPIRIRALQLARDDDPEAWFQLWHILHWDDEPWGYVPFSQIDVETFKGWNLLSPEEQKIARRSALRFLESYPGDSSEWKPDSFRALSSTSALWLLRGRLDSDPSLAKIVSNRWIRLFAGFHLNEGKVAAELFSQLNKIDHATALATLLTEVETDRQHIRSPCALRVAKQCWDSRFNDALRSYAQSLVDPKTIGATIDEWKNLDSQAAGDYALARLHMCLPEVGGTYPISLKELIVTTMTVRPVETFVLVRNLLSADDRLAESVWSEVLQEVESRRDEWWTQWSEEGLADLYLHLTRILPRSGDPHHDVGFVAPRTSAAWARDRIPSNIAARSTREACRALSRLIQSLPEQAANLRWSYRNALVQCRRNEWNPPSPESVVRLFENAESRLVSSEKDLQEVVLESLERFQRHLTQQTLPAVEELWNHIPVEGARSRRLEPKDEKVLQQAVARWLRDDLGPARGVIVNCEVEPRLGSFTDIYVDALRQDQQGTFERMTVVIEVKGCWHEHVRTAMHSQLVNGYLRANGLIAGIYLVGWFVCDACASVGNRTGAGNIAEAVQWLDAELARYDGTLEPEHVEDFILDCSWPQTAPSRERAVPGR